MTGAELVDAIQKHSENSGQVLVCADGSAVDYDVISVSPDRHGTLTIWVVEHREATSC